MNNKSMSTVDKILCAAEDLMSTKGYKSVTIKEIASSASVSEMTVFRTFGTKKAILDAIISRYPNSLSMKDYFKNNLLFDLDKDLLEISKFYHKLMNKHKRAYLISIMERNTMPNMHLILHKHAEELRDLLIEYFKTMQSKEKVVKGDPETQALMLMNFNYGKFVSDALVGESLSSLPLDNYLTDVIPSLSEGLKP